MELLSERDELISFFYSLPPSTQSRVKLCVDTCHVLSAGYQPDEYIREIHECGIEIRLIHYNDSYYPKGCRKDKHAPPLEGYVGFNSLQRTLSFAIQHNIPCVFE